MAVAGEVKKPEEQRKLAIVFGVGPGIGLEIVNTLQKLQWQVVAVSRDDCDLADLDAVARYADELRAQYPVVHAVVHAAGIWHDEQEAFVNRDLEDYDPAWIAATMNVGVTSFMMLAAKLLPNIAREGFVIGISAMFEIGAHRTVDAPDIHAASGWLPYYTSKRALEDFLVGLAQDYRSGPLVYGIAPGDTNTPAMEQFFPEIASTAQPAHSVSLLVEHLLQGDAPYHSGDIIAVKARISGKGYHS